MKAVGVDTRRGRVIYWQSETTGQLICPVSEKDLRFCRELAESFGRLGRALTRRR